MADFPHDLSDIGIPEVPVFGISHYSQTMPAAHPHQHHGVIEISCCMRGSETFECSRREFPFLPGTITIARPSDKHRFSGRTKNASKYWMFLSVPSSSPWLGLPAKESAYVIGKIRRLPNVLYDESGKFRRQFASALQLLQQNGIRTPELQIRMRHLILGIILSLLSASQSERHISCEEKIDAIITDMRQHPERCFSLNDLVNRCYLSPSNILRRFKTVTGLPPHAFLLRCKIEAAKEKLREGMKASRVAKMLGFATARHFSSQFKSHTGTTPARFSESNRERVTKSDSGSKVRIVT